MKFGNFKKIFLLLFIIFLLSFPLITFSQEVEPEEKGLPFDPAIKIPELEITEVGKRTLADYISKFYKWSVTAIAILAVIMIMISGLQWIFSAGNPPAIQKAREQMTAAIIGLVLILLAIPILRMINPALVRLKTFEIPAIVRKEFSDEIDLEIFLTDPMSGNVGNDILKIDKNKSGDDFCLYRSSYSYDSQNQCYFDDSGKCVFIGGPRNIIAALFFPGNRRVEKVAIKGFWKKQGGGNEASICKKDNGCGNGEDGWMFSIYSNLKQEICLLGLLNAPCSMVLARKDNVIKWEGERGRFGDPDIWTQKKGEFKLEVTMFSRKNPPEFKPITGSFDFTQTCGIGVESNCQGSGTKYCCKEKKEVRGWKGYYYDFHCSLAQRCNEKNSNWIEQTKNKKEYCNID